MKSSLTLSFVVVSAVLLIGVWRGGAAPPNAPAPEVAAIDIAKVLKGNEKFNAKMEQLKQDVETAETNLNKKRDFITDMDQQLANLFRDDPTYKQLEADILRAKTDFNNETKDVKKELMEKESAIYSQINQEINEEVAAVAKSAGINIVIRQISKEPGDPKDRAEVARELTKPLVYVNPKVDLTQLVIDRLKAIVPKPAQSDPNPGPIPVLPPQSEAENPK